MKKKILVLFTSMFLWISSTFAADVDHFEVKLSPKSAKVWEAFDLTVIAQDKNNQTVTDFTWDVLIFSQSNLEATLPSVLRDWAYTFTAADEWIIKFENWVKFSKPGTQDIYVFDLVRETTYWSAEVEVIENGSVWKEEIEIVSPENWLTIWKNNVTVSWTTVKNHKVKIIVNWKDEYEVNSNDNWIFEKEIENLPNWENSIKAQVLDSDENVIWETISVNVKVEWAEPILKSIKLIPSEVFVDGNYDIEILTDSWLREVNVTINDTLIILKDSGNGLYTWNSIAPKQAWTYPVNVQLTNEFGKKSTVVWAANLEVKELNAALAQEKEPEVKEEEPELQAPSNERDPLKITWLKLVKLKTKSILSWNKLENAKSYNVYKKVNWKMELVTTVYEPRFEVEIEWKEVKYDDFYIRANWQDENGTYMWELSDPTQIQTWPELLILILITLFFSGLYLFYKWRKEA